ncbi:MAG: GNAT family N-acetyltransferase [Paludibacteraceae bacterium]|nr:GNAT family N-acetyltransferase [Paludibacteraceae bacterium]
MAHILTYDLIDRQQWSELVRTSETGTWFQSPEAYDFFASLPELMEPFVYGVERAEKLCAVCVGYVTKERNPIKQFLTRRAIIIGGVAVAANGAKEDVVILLNYVRKELKPKSIYIETRNFNDFSPWKEAFEAAGFVYKPHLNFHVDPATNNLSDNRKRQLKKSDAVVSEGVSELEIREWYEVLSELYRTKVKTPLWPIDFFLEAYRQGIAKFLLVKHEGRIIGGSMVVADERTVYEWFECGLNAECKDQYPSVMATWGGIQLAHQSGCTRYDMMGAGEPGVPYGVRDFKAEFGGQMVEHGRFLCVCKPMLYRLGVCVVKILKNR